MDGLGITVLLSVYAGVLASILGTGIDAVDKEQIEAAQHFLPVFEELCVQTLLGRGGPVLPLQFACAVSELDGVCEATITYGGPPSDPFAALADDLSIKMVLGLTRQHQWRADNGNQITLTL